MMPFKYLAHVLLGCLTLGLVGASTAFGETPNIIVIFNDDQGYQDLGCFGSPDIKTPHVDQLAAEGMRFTDFYVASPVCSASRAALLTGCYPFRVGVAKVFFPNRGHQGLDPKHVTMAEMFKSVGYATAAVGKWHLGDEVEFLPTRQGFDSYYGIPYSNDMTPSKNMKYADDCLFLEGESLETLADGFAGKLNKGSPASHQEKVPLMRNEECIEFPVDQTTITGRFADAGIDFIQKSVQAEQPFFLYLANSMPHVPLFASKDFKGKSERGLYGDVIEEIDYNAGRILAQLKAFNVEDNTIVVFTSDNGPWLTKGAAGGSALPLFEGKFTNFDGGQRVPAIIRWPGKVPAGSVCNAVVSSIDLMPTFAAIVGSKLDYTMPLDGVNILDVIKGKEDVKPPHEYFFFVHNAVRSGDWKYHKKEVFNVKATKRNTGGPTLYNLKEDIGESQNVIKDHPEIAKRLAQALEDHIVATPRPVETPQPSSKSK